MNKKEMPGPVLLNSSGTVALLQWNLNKSLLPVVLTT